MHASATRIGQYFEDGGYEIIPNVLSSLDPDDLARLMSGILGNKAVRAPTYAQIIRILNDRRASFEKLSALVLEDASKGPWFSESWLSPLLNDERRQVYRDLLRQIRPGLVVGISKGSVRFIFVSTGVAIGPGWFKGVARITDDPRSWGTVVGDLDHPRVLTADTLYLRRIESNWYIVFERSS
jgi:hypothetical protein